MIYIIYYKNPLRKARFGYAPPSQNSSGRDSVSKKDFSEGTLSVNTIITQVNFNGWFWPISGGWTNSNGRRPKGEHAKGSRHKNAHLFDVH